MQITTAQLTTYSRLSSYLYKNSSKRSVVIGGDASRKVAPYLHAFIQLIRDGSSSNHIIYCWDGSSTLFSLYLPRKQHALLEPTCSRFFCFLWHSLSSSQSWAKNSKFSWPYLINYMHKNYIGDARSRVSICTFHATRKNIIMSTKAYFGQCPGSRWIQSLVWRK
jgi:hypothetical protein